MGFISRKRFVPNCDSTAVPGGPAWDLDRVIANGATELARIYVQFWFLEAHFVVTSSIKSFFREGAQIPQKTNHQLSEVNCLYRLRRADSYEAVQPQARQTVDLGEVNEKIEELNQISGSPPPKIGFQKSGSLPQKQGRFFNSVLKETLHY